MELNKLGKLGVAILEGFVGKHLGEGFIDELKSDFQTHDNLLRAMIETERIFRKTCEDKEFCKTIFDDLPITDLKPIQEAAQSFYSNPSDPILSETLKEIFVRDLKQFIPVDIEKHINSYISVLTQQLTILDEKFSIKVNTLANLATTESAKEILRVMKGFAQDVRQLSAAEEHLLISKYEKATKQNQEMPFSDEIRTQLALVNKTIEELTKDQFQVIKWLSGKKRAAISGCAGSGKTLVAVEKAVRLAHAGLRVLILCHSPNLAAYIEKLTRNTGVQVCDFTTWIKDTIARKPTNNYPIEWTQLDEPTDEELNVAFDLISTSANKFEAIVVDEGQDFRDTWWLVIEEALVSPKHGILYIFFDDNQALLPYRAKYPIEESPVSLSKNCRNSGKVFNFVKEFHPQHPEESLFLSNSGILRWDVFHSDRDAKSVAEKAISHSLMDLSKDQIVVLTTEPAPASKSILNLAELTFSENWRGFVIKKFFDMKDSVERVNYINKRIKHQLIDYLLEQLAMVTSDIETWIDKLISELSYSPYPTQDDIYLVVNTANKISELIESAQILYLEIERLFNRQGYISWLGRRIIDPHLIVKASRYLHGLSTETNIFRQNNWVNMLSVNFKYKIVPGEKIGQDVDCIPLYTVSSYKGLESDGIILFIRSPRDTIMPTPIPDIYVGSSRARFLLHLVFPHEVYKSISQKIEN